MSDSGASFATTTVPHSLRQAAKRLVSDLLSVLTFAVLYVATRSVTIGVFGGIAVGFGQMAYLRRRRTPIATMQWLSLFLVVMLGGAAVVTRNPAFLMMEPTLNYLAVGVVMLRPGWMSRYVPERVRARSADITNVFGYVWALLMFATAAANLAVAWLAGPAAWVWFIGVVPVTSKIMLLLTQYVVMRVIVHRRIRSMA